MKKINKMMSLDRHAAYRLGQVLGGDAEIYSFSYGVGIVSQRMKEEADKAKELLDNIYNGLENLTTNGISGKIAGQIITACNKEKDILYAYYDILLALSQQTGDIKSESESVEEKIKALCAGGE